MADVRTLLEQGYANATPPPDGYERMLRRRDRKRRNQRIAAGVVGIAVFAAAIWIVTSVSSVDRGDTSVDPAATGNAAVKPYRILHGEVTFGADPSWSRFYDYGPETIALALGRGELAVMADPLPVETGCREGLPPADAAALAGSIQSDPDLQATEPVAVVIGGIEGLQMDVVAAKGASVCEKATGPLVVGQPAPVREAGLELIGLDLHPKDRMRLYVLDLPAGSSAQIVVIAIDAPDVDFDHVVETAAPIVDSFAFQPGLSR